MKKQSKKILLVAGEASGDHHGSLVVKALKEIDSSFSFYGIGGDELSKEGMEIICHSRDLSVVGISEVFSRANHIFRAYRSLKKEIDKRPPELVFLIDYPDFNLRIADIARKHNVPVLYYISPQIWAWRKGRAKKISRVVNRMAVIFPFEVSLFEEEGLDAQFVGHPLLDKEINLMERSDALRFYNLEAGWPIIGILPGSRPNEIDRLLDPMLRAVEIIHKEFTSARFILPLAPGISRDHVQNMIKQRKVSVKIVADNFYQAIDVCDMVLVASGTATLETAIMGKPMIIIYKVSLLSYLIGKMLIKVPCIGLVNIVAGKKVVPELIQGDATPEKIAQEAMSILKDSKRMESIKSELENIKIGLGNKGASRRVARIAYEMLTQNV